MAAQALSSVADNALLIAAIALIVDLSGPDWMAPLMKWWFALAYVVLAAFVGAFADAFPKGKVMFITNGIKVLGCMLMFGVHYLADHQDSQLFLVFFAYTLVGIGAAAYSPAKYGIVTEMLKPELLVKGNSWIEGLTVLSIILGTVLGGILIHPDISPMLRAAPILNAIPISQTETAILLIGLIYLAAAAFNLVIPNTNIIYPKQQTKPLELLNTFKGYVIILWQDKIGQISLAVTTLFWGAGATLQFIVIEWAAHQLDYRLDQASILMGVTAMGTVVGAYLAGKVPLKKALHVLPIGVLMGISVLLIPFVQSTWAVYSLLIFIGATSGFFVVPMNALLQHRGHVLLSAGHSIAVQNFNEQLNILFMLSLYSFMLWIKIPINVIITFFGIMVALLMIVFIYWDKRNHALNPSLDDCIGEECHGTALR